MKYTKSVLLFGFAIPIAVFFVVSASLILGLVKFNDLYNTKKKAWEEHQQRLVEIASLEKKLEPLRPKILLYNDILGRDIQNGVGRFLDSSVGGSSDFISRTLLEFPINSSDGGRQVKAGFLARYSYLQNMLLEMEMRFPQLKLNSLTLSRVKENKTIQTPHLTAMIEFSSATLKKQKVKHNTSSESVN